LVTLDFTGILRPEDPELGPPVKTDSGLRTRAADDLCSYLEPYLQDFAITRVAHITGFDYVGLPVHTAIKPQGRSLSGGSGKGSTTSASWVSAVMECCEQTIWENLDLERVVASESVMKRMGVRTVDAGRLPLLRGAIYNTEVPVAWTAGWDIVRGEEVYVPLVAVQVRTDTNRGFTPFAAGANGLASGVHVLEAVLSGLQEVVERDGVTLYSSVQRVPEQSAQTLLEQAAPSIAERVARSGLGLTVRDCTTELGIPVFSAYLHDYEGNSGSFRGSGAGASTVTALVRAVTEAAQSRCLIVAGARDDVFESDRSAAVNWVSRPSPARPLEEVTDTFDLGALSILEALTWMVDRLVEHGFDRVVVLRHSNPGDPVQVVRIVVPGLEGWSNSDTGLGERAQALSRGSNLKGLESQR